MKVKSGVSYGEIINKPKKKAKKPIKPNVLFRTLMRVASMPDLIATKFKYSLVGMDRLKKNEPCLFLMNHSSFIDLKMASKILYPRPYNIICTSDGMIGRNWLMRQLGCIPTRKFVSEVNLLHDMLYAVKGRNCSILMYPEAGYSFDGTSTTLPDSLGRCIKMLGIPVAVITSYGAFIRDPLYNNLQKRKVKVSASVEYLLSPEEIAEKNPKEINALIREKFSFDGFRWQQENGITVDEPFRADSLNRVLYKCPHCLVDGKTEGKGTVLVCRACGKEYELGEDGYMKAVEGETEFSHIPDWYAWERECVKEEILAGKYSLDIPVDICMAVDTKCLYDIGEGRLVHNKDGFVLTGCNGELEYKQKPLASYSLNSDYYWYKLGDMISIGDKNALYYCFPKCEEDVVTKARLAAEEIYKIVKKETRSKPKEI